MKSWFKRHKSLVRTVGIVGFAGAFFLAGIILLWVASFKIPDLKTIHERKVAQSTKIYDNTGEILLYDVHENVRRTLVSYEDISRYVKNATVAIEDAEFYEHHGIKPDAFIRALLVNVREGGYKQGGSTLTQQVIKNSILTSEKTISRKLKEWVLALKLEQELSKEEILNLYLNEAPYGGNIYGVEEASQMYFNKPASDITLTEAAYLAALPQAPTYLSPYGSHTAELEARKNLVLSRMLHDGFITDEEYSASMLVEVEFQPRAETGILAPHFVFYVLEELIATYGRRAIEERGFKVTTTLDLDLQTKAEEIVKTFALDNAEKFEAENAAIVAINPKTGDIITMVGSRDYFDEDIDGNFNIITTHRQPGSAFKPFVYATAFKQGYTPETVVFDLDTEFSTSCNPDGTKKYNSSDCYHPVNYTGTFAGPVSFRDALAQSMNIPAIKVLYLSGLRDSIRTAQDLGITSLTDPARYGLTLVLGGGEVSPLEITSAYGVFANDGVRNEHRAILSIEDHSGNIVFKSTVNPKQVLDESVARNISSILSDNNARAPLFGYNSLLKFLSYDVAAKTGTTNDYRDAWIIGYTPEIAVGAWVGNNDNSAMNEVSGLRVSPMWRAFMDEVLKTVPDTSFIPPAVETSVDIKPIIRGEWRGSETYIVDALSGKLATEYTPKDLQLERVIGEVHSILYWVDRNDPRGSAPDDPTDTSQFEYWEISVQKWAAGQGITTSSETEKPTEYDDIHTPQNMPRLSILGIDSGKIYSGVQKINILTNTSGVYPISKVEYFLNSVYLGVDTDSPFSFFFIPYDSGAKTGTNTISAVGYDIVSNRVEQTKTFIVK
ncbi:hypothetical protein COB55_02925 [Candidatus Wolfebacteria bacterium]|nr:MAG: hypothetical protein COB55_02925 [Candidatus Wolfebacteria bacterium]